MESTASLTPYEIIVGPDRAEAEDLDSAIAAARTLIDDNDNGFNRRQLRESAIVTLDGKYDGLATTMARTAQSSWWGR